MTGTTLYLATFLLVDTAVLLGLLIYFIGRRIKRRRIRHYGDRAEQLVEDTLKQEFQGAAVLRNVFLPNGRGSTQIDHILLSKWGVWVIETKSHNGTIRASGREWVQLWGDKVVYFHSPLKQNEIHRKALEALLREKKAFHGIRVRAVTVFTSDKVQLPRGKEGIVRLKDLARYVKGGGKLSPRRMPLTGDLHGRYLDRQKILRLESYIKKRCVKSRRGKKEHERRVRRRDRNRL